jgi:hypothetical protein
MDQSQNSEETMRTPPRNGYTIGLFECFKESRLSLPSLFVPFCGTGGVLGYGVSRLRELNPLSQPSEVTVYILSGLCVFLYISTGSLFFNFAVSDLFLISIAYVLMFMMFARFSLLSIRKYLYTTGRIAYPDSSLLEVLSVFLCFPCATVQTVHELENVITREKAGEGDGQTVRRTIAIV